MDKMEVQNIARNPSPAESSEDLEIIFESSKDVERTSPSELTDYTEMEGLDNEDNSDLDAEELEVQNIARNPSPAESSEDLEIIFESSKDVERTSPSELTDYTEMEGLDNEDNSDLDAEELDNFNLSGISDDDFDLKISTKDKKGNSANPNFPTKIVHKPKKNPQVLEQIKRECPHGVPIKAKPCKVHIPKRKAKLLNLLKRKCPRREPIVGLNEILEIEGTPKGNDFSYDCLACGLNFSAFKIIKHLISLKHRTEYLNVIDYPGLEIIYGDCPRVKNLVKKMCIEVQRCEGMGKPAVIKIIYPKGMSGQAEKSGTSN